MLHILHLSTARSWRGGEQQIANLLQELRKKEVSQIVICPKGTPLEQYCINNKFLYKSVKKYFGLDFLFAWHVYKTCKKNKINIIHAHDPQAHTTAVFNSFFLMAFSKKEPMIVINRRVIFPIKQSFFTKFKYNYSKVKRIICVSHAVKEEVQKIVKEDKVTVIHSSINVSNKDLFTAGLLLREFNISYTKQIVATVSALTKEKGIEIFLTTAQLLLKENKNLHFVIIGEGKLMEVLENQSKEIGIQEYVSFLGFRKNIKELLLDVDLLLFTSHSEGLGTSLLEAVEMNVPIVAYNTGGIPEIIKHLQTGYLVQEYSALAFAKAAKELLNNPALCAAIKKKAQENLSDFSAYKMANSTLMVYEDILGNRTA